MSSLSHFTRRTLLGSAGGAFVNGFIPAWGAEAPPLAPGLPDGAYATATMEAPAGKRPLIRLTQRPMNYETPASYFTDAVTPNDAFFVRYHLSGVPARINPQTWRLEIGGEAAASQLSLSLSDLQTGFDQVEIAAVCQCSGNRRGFSEPHVPGVQWGSGAMGSAVWRGVRLKDILDKAGIAKDAVEIVFDGADGPPLTDTPDFVKSIPAAKAMDENTLVAITMNGEPIPHFNGAPARLIVPGWTATYWMKHLTSIRAVSRAFDGFWMRGAYRVPNGMFPMVQRFLTQETEANTPITEIVVNSLIAAPTEGQRFRRGEPITVQGVAWDAGYGITSVSVSADSGASWEEAILGPDQGRFAFRTFSHRFIANAPGTRHILARARNRIGQTQVDTLLFNGAGYHNNVVRPASIVVA